MTAEIAGMALDAGLIPYGREVVAVGGTIEGADSLMAREMVNQMAVLNG